METPLLQQYSWSQLDSALSRVVPELKECGITAVAGLHAGVIPAAILANRLPASLHMLNPERLLSFQCSESSLLLVSDLDSLSLLDAVKAKLTFHDAVIRHNYKSCLSIYTLSVHTQKESKVCPDFVLEAEPISESVWVKYPWE